MAIGTIKLYDQSVTGHTNGLFNWATDQWKMTLHNSNYTPAVSDTSFDAIASSEVSGNGYPAGGYPIVKAYTSVGTTAKVTITNILVLALGGTLVAKTAVAHKIGTVGGVENPLLFYIPLDSSGADVTILDGQGITINFNSQTGAFVLTAP